MLLKHLEKKWLKALFLSLTFFAFLYTAPVFFDTPLAEGSSNRSDCCVSSGTAPCTDGTLTEVIHQERMNHDLCIRYEATSNSDGQFFHSSTAGIGNFIALLPAESETPETIKLLTQPSNGSLSPFNLRTSLFSDRPQAFLRFHHLFILNSAFRI